MIRARDLPRKSEDQRPNRFPDGHCIRESRQNSSAEYRCIHPLQLKYLANKSAAPTIKKIPTGQAKIHHETIMLSPSRVEPHRHPTTSLARKTKRNSRRSEKTASWRSAAPKRREPAMQSKSGTTHAPPQATQRCCQRLRNTNTPRTNRPRGRQMSKSTEAHSAKWVCRTRNPNLSKPAKKKKPKHTPTNGAIRGNKRLCSNDAEGGLTSMQTSADINSHATPSPNHLPPNREYVFLLPRHAWGFHPPIYPCFSS